MSNTHKEQCAICKRVRVDSNLIPMRHKRILSPYVLVCKDGHKEAGQSLTCIQRVEKENKQYWRDELVRNRKGRSSRTGGWKYETY